jgi:DNA-binding transcriptional MerR regulator
VDRTKGQRSEQYAIPNKLYFRIGEVSDLVGVKPYVLRYWESEFPDIKPSKSKSGQRLYKRKDVELLLKIKELLYEERFTINGARKRLKDFGRGEHKETPQVAEAPAAQVPVKGDPRQLDVFATHDPEEDALPVAGTHGAAQVPVRDQTKTFMKIRKDLEELLHMVKA